MTTTLARPVRTRAFATPLDLLQAQLRGIDLWQAQLRAAAEAVGTSGRSREHRLDAARLLDVRRREQQAVLARTRDEGSRCTDPTAGGGVRLRAVVAHRHAWTRGALLRELAVRGVEVLDDGDNGADAVGVCVAEQPDLVVLDDTLAMRSGAEVAAELGRFCPGAVVAGLVTRDEAVAPLLRAGASPVFTRRVPPGVVAEELVALLPP